MRWIRSQENFKRFPLEAALTRLWSRDFVDGDVFGLSIWQYFFSCPLIKKPENFIISDASNVKQFCWRCKAHGFKAGIHSACPFKCCKCAECEKIAKHNEMAREKDVPTSWPDHCYPQAALTWLLSKSSNLQTRTRVLKWRKKRCPQLPLKPVCCQLHDLLIQFFVNLPFQLF